VTIQLALTGAISVKWLNEKIVGMVNDSRCKVKLYDDDDDDDDDDVHDEVAHW